MLMNSSLTNGTNGGGNGGGSSSSNASTNGSGGTIINMSGNPGHQSYGHYIHNNHSTAYQNDLNTNYYLRGANGGNNMVDSGHTIMSSSGMNNSGYMRGRNGLNGGTTGGGVGIGPMNNGGGGGVGMHLKNNGLSNNYRFRNNTGDQEIMMFSIVYSLFVLYMFV